MASLQCFVMFLLIYKFFGFFILLQDTLMLKAVKSTSRRAEAAGWELARAKCAFGRDSKAGRGMGRLYREKGEEFYHVLSERCRHKDSLEAGQLLPQVWISLTDRELRVKQAWEMGERSWLSECVRWCWNSGLSASEVGLGFPGCSGQRLWVRVLLSHMVWPWPICLYCLILGIYYTHVAACSKILKGVKGFRSTPSS